MCDTLVDTHLFAASLHLSLSLRFFKIPLKKKKKKEGEL